MYFQSKYTEKIINQVKHIAVSGNIGAGKTTLAQKLSQHYSWEALFEDTVDNPYLSDFYDNMNRWSFNLQIYFLNSRFRQIVDIQSGDKTVIQDRTIYEDAKIFAPNLYEMGLMEKRDFENYLSLFDLMTSQINAPDLLIYLKGSIPKLVDHIQLRGRDYEGSISLDYLKRLNKKYNDWINSYTLGKLLVVDIDKYDFVTKSEDFGTIVGMIDKELFGLF